MSDYPSTAQLHQWHDLQASFKVITGQLEEWKAPCMSTAWERTGQVIMTRHTACIHRRYAELNSQALQVTGLSLFMSSPRYARIDTALEPSDAMIFSLFCLATLHGMGDLSSLTRDRTCAPCFASTESQSLDNQQVPQCDDFHNL